ncbi:hypothetical protein EIK77_002726 [Talaromyces pinophilus]|nr:hypothetical protein EIK77_002726 [Talaromyces pinophilus]
MNCRFGGLIAAGVLDDVNGAHGIAGWRWLFIIEGSATVGIALIAIWIMPNYPSTTRWLNVEEKHYAEWRLAQDAAGEVDDRYAITPMQAVRMAFKDWKLYLFMIMHHLNLLSQSFTYFFPSIVKSLGYNNTTTLLLTVPVWFATFIVVLLVSYHSSRTKERSVHIACCMLVGAIGNIIMITTKNLGARMFAMYLLPIGVLPPFQIILAWITSTFARPLAKRSVIVAICGMFGNASSIYGSYLYPDSQAPSRVTAAALLLTLKSANALLLPDDVGRLPALGWNSWNAYGCNVDETKIVTAATKLNTTGLQALGYQYVNIDDCWSVKSGRDNVTNRIIPNPDTFPNGINGTAQQVHDLGLKIGIYSSAGYETCAGYPASLGYETIDAQTFAEWGIDYLKYDNCNYPSEWDDEYNACIPDSDYPGVNPNGTCPGLTNPAPAGYDWSTSNTTKRFNIMRDALVAVQDQRVILYSLCEWGYADVPSWGNGTGNSWRVTGDINATWDRITAIANMNAHELSSVDFWGHNDPDMLEVGNGDLTIEENRAHFALWAIMKSPLIIGTDVRLFPFPLSLLPSIQPDLLTLKL